MLLSNRPNRRAERFPGSEAADEAFISNNWTESSLVHYSYAFPISHIKSRAAGGNIRPLLSITPRKSETPIMGLMREFVTAGVLLASALITVWMVGAIYYDACQGGRIAPWFALAWVAGVMALFVAWKPLWQPFAVLVGVTALFLIWWFRQKPSNDRDWDPAVAVLARAKRDGDAITIENLRNFEYRSLDDFDPRYESRTYHLSKLAGVDIILFNWGSAIMSHPVLVFDFGPDGRVCVSIEVRYQRGQKYLILRSLYRFYELIFLVADERDAILRRTKYGPSQEAHLYRIVTPVEEMRATFLDYIEAINALNHTPRWYNGLCTNCTTAFYRLPSRRVLFDWRVLANARLDRALYAKGRLDRSLPFEELRRLARINEIANIAPEADFGNHLRRELERRRNE
jgi:hypothetical protein